MLGDRVALEAKVNAELGVSMPEALWDQLDRDPKQVAPVMAGMLRDQLSMADRLRQTFAPEAKQSCATCDAERDPSKLFTMAPFPGGPFDCLVGIGGGCLALSWGSPIRLAGVRAIACGSSQMQRLGFWGKRSVN